MSIVLAAASAMLIFNMIQLPCSLVDEIEVMKLVGATNSFIRLPFILEGMLHGLAGGLVGAAAAAVLRNHVEELSGVLKFSRSLGHSLLRQDSSLLRHWRLFSWGSLSELSVQHSQLDAF